MTRNEKYRNSKKVQFNFLIDENIFLKFKHLSIDNKTSMTKMLVKAVNKIIEDKTLVEV